MPVRRIDGRGRSRTCRRVLTASRQPPKAHADLAAEPDWEIWRPNVRATLLFIQQHGNVLLIRKKRGLGAGKINGPGGKIDPGESALDCAVRETREELGIIALDPKLAGELCFAFTDGMHMHVSVFRGTMFEGDPIETPEAKPLWFPVSDLPFDEMWADDRHWLSEMLGGKSFRGFFLFDDDTMLTRRVEFAGAP